MNLNLVKANSGEEALEKLICGDFAVILLDVRMPDMDGFETAVAISQRDPNRNTPVIFLTAAQENEEDKVRAYDVGGIDYLLKPFNPSVLRAKVSILINLYRHALDMRELVDKLKRNNGELEDLNLKLKTEMKKTSSRAPL
jgi:DNA-binding response OmpR family regulator